jgi:hypothetical protein
MWMFRQSIVGLLFVSMIGIASLAGCDAGGSGTTPAPEGHDGKSAATGHAGGGPAGGPMSPEGKAEAKKAAAGK